jgi:MFS family permease
MTIASHIGLPTIASSGRNQRVLIAQKFFRMLAYGQTMLILALYFQELDMTESRIGLFMSATLIGDVIISYLLTRYADAIGRRLVLMFGALAMAVSGAVFATCSNYWVLLMAAVVGVISPSGDEIGPFRAVEESTLAHLTKYEDRPDIFAWQGMFGTLGSALGSLSAGAIGDYLRTGQNMSPLEGYRVIFWMYSAISGVMVVLSLMLTKECEHDPHHYEHVGHDDVSDETTGLLGLRQSQSLSKSTKAILIRLCLVFGMDSLAYGFMPNTWLVVYFKDRFGVSETRLGSLFFGTNLIGAATAVLSSMLCKLVGPILAIAATKAPSAAFMGAVPLSPSAAVAMACIIARAFTDSMDVVPRQVFLTSAVHPRDRTRVMGIVNVVKTFARSIGPLFTGYMSEAGMLGFSFFVVMVLEGSFAIGVTALFRDVKYN